MGDLIPFPSRHDPILTKVALAGYWRCSTKTIERYMALGLPSFLRNGKRRFRLSVAERWRDERKVAV